MHRAGCGDNNIPVVGTPRQQLRRRTEPHHTSVMESPRSSTRALAPSCSAVAWLRGARKCGKKNEGRTRTSTASRRSKENSSTRWDFETLCAILSLGNRPRGGVRATWLFASAAGGPTSVALFFSMKTQNQRNGKERVDRRERKRRRCKKPCSAHLATVSKIQVSTKEQRTDRSIERTELRDLSVGNGSRVRSSRVERQAPY